MSARGASGRWQRSLTALLVALVGCSWLAVPEGSRAAQAGGDPRAACRSWTNQWQPPPTIRVYRTRGPNTGKVQTVDFRRYVAVVMAAEWPAAMPREALRAGALAVKQYAWYYNVFYRGWLAPDGRCFHVMDTSMDQVYNPEVRTPHARHLDALTSTWQISLRKPRPGGASRLILTSYRAGRYVACGSDSDGLKLFQWSSAACARQGLGMKDILRTYYGRDLQFVDVRPHNILPDAGWRGDVAVLAGRPNSGSSEWRIYAAGAGGFRAPLRGRLALDTAFVLDSAVADVTGNGLGDLVLLTRDGQLGRRLLVLRAGKAGYGRPQLWARWRENAAGDARSLLLADFTGNGLADAAVMRTIKHGSAGYRQARLLVLPALPGGTFGSAQSWWSGGFDAQVNLALAGDVTGDGRADLIVRQDRGRQGLRYWVMASRRSAGLAAPRLWFEQRDWRAAATREVVIDENRDGRDDLFVVRQSGPGRLAVIALRARPSAGFTATLRWQSPRSGALDVSLVQPVGFHADLDGRGDLALFERTSNGRTRAYWLRTTDSGMVLSRALIDRDLRWTRATIR